MKKRLYCLLGYVSLISILWFSLAVYGQSDLTLPGDAQAITKLNAAGTLLHLVDSFVFVFGARILAGLCVLAAGWNLKEQRFSMCIVCIFGAIMIATVPLWIKNIFDMGGGSIFTKN